MNPTQKPDPCGSRKLRGSDARTRTQKRRGPRAVLSLAPPPPLGDGHLSKDLGLPAEE